MNDRGTQANAFGEMFAAWKNLLDAQVALASRVAQSLTGMEMPSAADLMRTLRSRGTTTCCRIPPPCWMPQPLGDCTSHVGRCKSACIRLAVTNCDRVAHTMAVESSNKKLDVTVSPSSLSLGPMERGSISVCIDIPQDTADGTRYDTIIWVRGCNEYFVRWTVSVGTVGFDSCHEIAVNDCPDLVHHWYDHFYCVRECRSERRTANAAVAHG